ncbi:MAG: hypothetical protein AVDCRST_MAG22-3581, partial [uncultured Rubrobacteraceae bacterium]
AGRFSVRHSPGRRKRPRPPGRRTGRGPDSLGWRGSVRTGGGDTRPGHGRGTKVGPRTGNARPCCRARRQPLRGKTGSLRHRCGGARGRTDDRTV